MNTTYKFYCMSKMLFDKSYNYYIEQDNSDYVKVKRIFKIEKNMLNSLYDLTYEPTKITNNIYLGNAYNARNYYDLKDKNIGLIINCTENIPNYFEDHFEYDKVDVKDVNGVNIYNYIDKIVDVIESYIKNKNKNVLIHCFMGSSRSATIMIAYLIKYKNYRLRDALNFVKDKRDIVNLNVDFFNQLKKYDHYINNNHQLKIEN